MGQYCTASYRRRDQTALREQQRVWRGWLTARGPAGGVRRLCYGLNPLLACASPLLAGQMVVRAAELLPALDAASGTADRTHPPIDADIAAFLVARVEPALAGDLPSLTSFAGEAERLGLLRLFADLQERLGGGPVPRLASWLITCGLAGVADWRNLKTRAALQDRLLRSAADGQICPMADLLDDAASRRADRDGAERAALQATSLRQSLQTHR